MSIRKAESGDSWSDAHSRDKVIEASDKFRKVFNFVLAMSMTLW